MLRSAKSCLVINATYELCVMEEVPFHFEMFAADRTVDNGGTAQAVNCSGCPGSHRAVNNDQSWAGLFDVFNGGANKVLAEWVTNMEHGARTISNHAFDVDPDATMMLANQFKQRPTTFAEHHHTNLI